MSQRIGDTSIQALPGYSLHRDLYGIHTLTRPFSGEEDDLVRFLTWMDKNPQDQTHKDFFYTDASVIGRMGLTVEVSVNFKGVPGLSNGRPLFSFPTMTKTLATRKILIVASNGSGREVEITYKAPSTTYKYAAAKEPRGPRFAGAMRFFKDSFKLVSAVGYRDYPFEIVQDPTSVVVTGGGKFQVFQSVITEDFTAQQVGRVWEVTERNDGILYGMEALFSYGRLNVSDLDRPRIAGA